MNNAQKGILKGIIGAIGISALIIAAYLFLAFIFEMPAHAGTLKDEHIKWPFPEPPYIEFGLDTSLHRDNPFCRPPYSKSYDNIHSNIRLGQTLLEEKRKSIELEYVHNSCAFNIDRNTNDSVGVVFRWSPWK